MLSQNTLKYFELSFSQRVTPYPNAISTCILYYTIKHTHIYLNLAYVHKGEKRLTDFSFNYVKIFIVTSLQASKKGKVIFERMSPRWLQKLSFVNRKKFYTRDLLFNKSIYRICENIC